MEYVRILSRQHWDGRKGRFNSLAFTPSSTDGGISVFDKQCAVLRSGTICGHIRTFYHRISDEPPIFWEFSNSILPQGTTFTEEVSDQGDECHRNISGLDKKQARDVFRGIGFQEFQMCEDGSSRRLQLEDLQ